MTAHQAGTALVGRHTPRCHPIAPCAEAGAPEMVRFHRGLVAALGHVRRAPLVMLTGAGPGVGTSHVLRGLGDAVALTGVPTASFDLSAAQAGLDPLIARTRAMPGGALVPSEEDGPSVPFRDPAFGLILVDAAPIRGCALALGLAGSLDGVVLVVGAERSTESEIRASLQAIEDCGARCLGLVMNRVPARRRWFGLGAARQPSVR